MSDKQTALTRADWDAASPRMKGYISYLQGAWNPLIPDVDKSPYPIASKEHKEFRRGAFEAALEVQEGDD